MQSGEGAEFLLDYSAGRLDPSRAGVVERHLRICSACSAFVATQKSVWNALDEWERIEVSPDFNRRLYQRIDFEEVNSSPAAKTVAMLKARWTPVSWKQAASAIAVCATVAMVLIADGPAWRSKPAPAQIEKTDVEQAEVALQDLDMLSQFKLNKTP